ncbi:MAG: hypothetical protein U0232_08140 [Thermomicrobiales bacterium]
MQRRSPDEPEGKQSGAIADATGCWTVERNDDRREQGCSTAMTTARMVSEVAGGAGGGMGCSGTPVEFRQANCTGAVDLQDVGAAGATGARRASDGGGE